MFNNKIAPGILLLVFVAVIVWRCEPRSAAAHLFEKSNLLAWCIVPYDAQNRNSEERAQMLSELGITMLAYDWREKHIPTFDEEWKALNNHNIEMQAFWLATGRDPASEKNVQAVFDFLERNNIKTQLWLLVFEWEGFDSLSQQGKVRAMAEPISYIADRAAAIGCEVALYNHRKWFGEPENQLAIINLLDKPNIGIVYNFHHGVEHHERFAEFFPKIQPHLMALNLAGIRRGDKNQFYGIGEGDVEQEMIRVVLESDYRGPVGIINHDEARDAKVGLLKEMNGLSRVLEELGEEKAARSLR